MGLQESAPTSEDLARMGELLKIAFKQGAFGMSTGLTYVPSRYAPFEELIYLCQVIKEAGRTYTSHARDYDVFGDDFFLGPLKEAFALARETGVRVQFSHAAINNPSLWGRAQDWVALFDSPEAKNLDVTFPKLMENDFYRGFMKLKGYAQFGGTVLSPIAQVRNVSGNFGFLFGMNLLGGKTSVAQIFKNEFDDVFKG
jgi:N-acyl-D-aspartate/D-glutamate deacylase